MLLKNYISEGRNQAVILYNTHMMCYSTTLFAVVSIGIFNLIYFPKEFTISCSNLCKYP
jgi:hypothetical protein